MSDPTRVVVDADVLAADLLVGGAAREALDLLFTHDWLTPVASEPLLEDAAAVVRAECDSGGASLAADWRARYESLATVVEIPDGDHPALAAAYRGDAAHLLTFDEELGGVGAGLAINRVTDCSVRTPAAFVAVFDAAALYEATHDDAYDGPDRNPRS